MWQILQHFVSQHAIIMLFLTISLGYLVGKLKYKTFVLGGISGSLLMGVLIGQFGVHIPTVLSTTFFALFIYAVGYQGGAQFFRSLNRKTAMELISSTLTCLIGLGCVLLCAWAFGLDRGTAAGLAAGGLTQSAMIGSSLNAIAHLGLSPQLAHTLSSNVAVGYAVCYIFGAFAPILLLATIFPAIMRWDLREEAVKLARMTEKHQSIDTPDEQTTAAAHIECVITHKHFIHITVAKLQEKLSKLGYKGIVVHRVMRFGDILPLDNNLKLKRGDDLHLIGDEKTLAKVLKLLGSSIPVGPVTDFISFGLGMVLGFLLGMLTFHIMGVSVTLGAGVGCLISGLIFGWIRSVKPQYGALPVGASNFLANFGLAVFVASVGLTAGPQAVIAIEQHGMALFLMGVGVTIVPIVLSFMISYSILRIRNPIQLLSTIAGGRSANPGFAALLEKAGNATPVLPFTASYTLANVWLTLFGPIVIALVTKNF